MARSRTGNCELWGKFGSSWFDGTGNQELLNLIPQLEKLSKVDSVYAVLKNKEQVQQNLQDVPYFLTTS